HKAIGGDMLQAIAPLDQIFVPHHVMLDCAWHHWQLQNPRRLYDYSGWKNRQKTVQVSLDDEIPVGNLLNGGKPPVVRDYMDTKGGKLCYEYER
ncbi:hypothetical protein MPER_00869, partial [Moniliophthora perniciosa FA553]